MKPVSFTCEKDSCVIYFGNYFGDERIRLAFPRKLYDLFLETDYEESDWGIICNWLNKSELEVLEENRTKLLLCAKEETQ